MHEQFDAVPWKPVANPWKKVMVCENMRRCTRARRMALDTNAPVANPAVQPQGVAERASLPSVLQQALGPKTNHDTRDARACKAIVAGAVCSHQRAQIALQRSHHGDWLAWPSVWVAEQLWVVLLCSWVCFGRRFIVARMAERRQAHQRRLPCLVFQRAPK